MTKSFYPYRIICAVLCILLLILPLGTTAFAEQVRTYSVTLDEPQSASNQNMPIVVRNVVHEDDAPLTIAGWVKTDLVMDYYEYTLDGGKTWVRVDNAVVARSDLKTICPNTYTTAGFHINIDVSGLLRGKYDVFVRGFTKQGDVIDIVAMLDISIGSVDVETLKYREINLKALGAQDNKIFLKTDDVALLGAHNLNAFERVEVLLNNSATLTLKAADADAYNAFSLKASGIQDQDSSRYIAEFSLKDVNYAGEISLSTDLDANIYHVRLYYNTPDYYTEDLKIFMTPSTHESLSGANMVVASLLTDDVVGTYTNLTPTGETNDPYIYFNVSNHLKQTEDIVISADHYRYAVLTVQTPPTNAPGHFRLFLCAGAIRGPSGNSHIAFQAINDGQWHNYIVPLYQEDDWTGQIYGMRFDFIDGNADSSDYANIAAVGFYPDLESAQAAADQPFQVYHEQGKIPEDKYKEENRAPSGKPDALTWFDQSYESCFGGANKASVDFDEYGHLILFATETTNDPFVSFDMHAYASIAGTPTLKADDYKIIVLRVMADQNISGKNFTLYYYSGGFGYAEGTRSVHANFKGDEWEYLVYDMSGAAHWTQDILGMRLDFASQINAGQKVYLSDVLFFADEGTWQAYAVEHGILTEDSFETIPNITTEAETERPTIEIPTQGPGLEYVPPETQENQSEPEPEQQTTQSAPQQQSGCAGTLSLSALLLFPVLFTLCYKPKTKKGD